MRFTHNCVDTLMSYRKARNPDGLPELSVTFFVWTGGLLVIIHINRERNQEDLYYGTQHIFAIVTTSDV